MSNDTMLIAVILIIAASLLDLTLLGGVRRTYWLASGATLVLLAPGVWYAFVAKTLRQAGTPLVKWTMFVAAGQLTVCVLAVPIAYFIDPGFFVATGILLFFLPALLVLLYQMWTARHLIRLREAARGFSITSSGEPIRATAVVADENVPIATVVQIDSVREK